MSVHSPRCVVGSGEGNGGVAEEDSIKQHLSYCFRLF